MTQLLENGKGRPKLGSLPPSLLTSSLGTGQHKHPVSVLDLGMGLSMEQSVTSIHSTAVPGPAEGGNEAGLHVVLQDTGSRVEWWQKGV